MCPPFWIIKSSRSQNSFVWFDHDVSVFSLTHSQAFVLSLYKRNTTRMVGRSDQIPSPISPRGPLLLYPPIPHEYMINSLQYPHTACISLILHIYLHGLHVIKSILHSYLINSFTSCRTKWSDLIFTACILLIPHYVGSRFIYISLLEWLSLHVEPSGLVMIITD